MITQYVEAINHALGGVLNHLTRLALPLAICLGLMAVAGVLLFVFQRDRLWFQEWEGRRHVANALGGMVVSLVVVAGWAALRTTLPVARQDIEWRESAEATANPVPEAPAVQQYGPAVAALTERTYTRNLTLPPDFFQRIGTEGLGVLSPYLTDPSAENVLRLVDTFRRSGRDVVFSRQVTRLDEEPIPFTTSLVRVRFRRLAGRAYDADFEGRYVFQNAGATPATVRFLFPLPSSNTVRDLNVSIGGQAVTEPSEAGNYEWKGEMAPGEQREAVVRYRSLGGQTWHYDLGSRRRRVQNFQLDAATGGPVRFMRGSLQPTTSASGALHWELANVVTAQQVAISFPPDIVGRESYLQALSALPASLIVFLIGVLIVGLRFRQRLSPGLLAAGLILFSLGLGSASILANYLGFVAGILLGPLVGAFLSARALGGRSLLAALPAALLPATLLSPTHSGLLALLLAVLALAFLLPTVRSGREIGT
jgi:hypothetical protein